MNEWRVGEVGSRCYAMEFDDEGYPTGRKYDPEGVSHLTARISAAKLRLTEARAKALVDKVNARGGIREV